MRLEPLDFIFTPIFSLWASVKDGKRDKEKYRRIKCRVNGNF